MNNNNNASEGISKFTWLVLAMGPGNLPMVKVPTAKMGPLSSIPVHDPTRCSVVVQTRTHTRFLMRFAGFG